MQHIISSCTRAPSSSCLESGSSIRSFRDCGLRMPPAPTLNVVVAAFRTRPQPPALSWIASRGGACDAPSLCPAHTPVESGRAKGKIVLEGFTASRRDPCLRRGWRGSPCSRRHGLCGARSSPRRSRDVPGPREPRSRWASSGPSAGPARARSLPITQQAMIIFSVRLQKQTEIEQRFSRHVVNAEIGRHDQTPGASIAVEEGMDRLEQHVEQPSLNEMRQAGGVFVHEPLELAQAGFEVRQGRRNEERVAGPRSADPVP